MPLLCWIITEGIAGTENQCLGVAEALGITPAVKRVALRQPWKTLSPYLGNESAWTFAPVGDRLKAPWPDLVLASGRKGIAAARYIKRLRGDRVFTVFIQDPRVSPSQFDLVAVPAHDRLRGPNVIVTAAAPNRITEKRLHEAHDDFAYIFEDAEKPRIAVLIGGSSKAYRMTEAVTQRLALQLRELAASHSLFITASRRTGDANRAILEHALRDTDAWIWNGEGENPYFGMLSWASHILVTADSVSMISEASTTGKPVSMIALEGGSPRIGTFHRTLMEKGILRPFDGRLESWTYPPLNDAAFVAAEIKKRLKSPLSE